MPASAIRQMAGSADAELDLLEILKKGGGIGKPSQVQVVIDVTGDLGGAIATELAAGPSRVKGVILGNSSPVRPIPESVELVKVDPEISGSIAGVCKGAETVYDCYEPGPSDAKDAMHRMSQQALSASIESGAGLVVASHLVNSPDDNLRAETAVLRAHSAGLVRAMVVRLPQLYGPWVVNGLWETIFTSVAKKNKAHWMGDPSVKRSLLYIEDAATMVALLGKSLWAYGRTWTLPGPEALDGNEFMTTAFKVAGLEPRIGHWGRGIMLTGSILGADSKKMLSLPYDFYAPFVLADRDFLESFPSVRFTPHEKAILDTLKWFESRMTSI